jgi:hypothetical protein
MRIMAAKKRKWALFAVLLLGAFAWVSQVSIVGSQTRPSCEGAATEQPTPAAIAWDELLHGSEPCASGINVLWILPNPNNKRGSSLWSGWEIAEAISASTLCSKSTKKIYISTYFTLFTC